MDKLYTQEYGGFYFIEGQEVSEKEYCYFLVYCEKIKDKIKDRMKNEQIQSR